MAKNEPQSKYELLVNIANEIIGKYILGQKGLKIYNQIELARCVKLAEANKVGDYAIYYFIKALESLIKGKYDKALGFFEKTMKLPHSHESIPANYAITLLVLGKVIEAKLVLDKFLEENNKPELKVNAFISVFQQFLILSLDDSLTSDLKGIDDKYVYRSKQALKMKSDLSCINISPSEYQDFSTFLASFIFEETRQGFNPRFELDIEKQSLIVEVFLDVNLNEVRYLNSAFSSKYIDYILSEERSNLLGKFVVFFRQNKNRIDGTKNPEDLYNSFNEELSL